MRWHRSLSSGLCLVSDIDDDHLISEVPAAAKELAGVAAGAVASELISRLASGKES